jgi:putative membrane protein
MKIRMLSLAVLSTAIAAPSAFAQVVSDAGTASRMAVNDSLFAVAAATGGMAELSLAELGVKKATDPELKRFSQQMIDEHTRMNQELLAAATQRGMALPRSVDARAQFCAQSLAGLSGEDFNRCYAKAQLVIHMDSVATFEAEAERGMDGTLKAVAAKALPHIKEHLKEIKPIAMKYEKEKPSTEGAAPAPRER